MGIEHIDDILADLDQALESPRGVEATLNHHHCRTPIPALFPAGCRSAQRIERLADPRAAAGAAARSRRAPSRRPSTCRSFAPSSKASISSKPRPLEELLRWAIERMEHGIVQMSNPRYFGLFNPGANFPAQCADRIAGLVQSATREFRFLSRARGTGKACDSRRRAPRRDSARRRPGILPPAAPRRTTPR